MKRPSSSSSQGVGAAWHRARCARGSRWLAPSSCAIGAIEPPAALLLLHICYSSATIMAIRLYGSRQRGSVLHVVAGVQL
jgi:hypothetical protein